MKWVSINKAKLKFNQDYLITDGRAAIVAQLTSTTQTAEGLVHQFNDPHDLIITHVAFISLPDLKED